MNRCDSMLPVHCEVTVWRLDVASGQDQTTRSASDGGAVADPAREEQPERQPGDSNGSVIRRDCMYRANTAQAKHEADQWSHRECPCHEVESWILEESPGTLKDRRGLGIIATSSRELHRFDKVISSTGQRCSQTCV